MKLTVEISSITILFCLAVLAYGNTSPVFLATILLPCLANQPIKNKGQLFKMNRRAESAYVNDMFKRKLMRLVSLKRKLLRRFKCRRNLTIFCTPCQILANKQKYKKHFIEN